MVTTPAVPPYSSTTIAWCTRERCISLSSSSIRFESGTSTGGRITSATWTSSAAAIRSLR